jgi:hypothetical protein
VSTAEVLLSGRTLSRRHPSSEHTLAQRRDRSLLDEGEPGTGRLPSLPPGGRASKRTAGWPIRFARPKEGQARSVPERTHSEIHRILFDAAWRGGILRREFQHGEGWSERRAPDPRKGHGKPAHQAHGRSLCPALPPVFHHCLSGLRCGSRCGAGRSGGILAFFDRPVPGRRWALLLRVRSNGGLAARTWRETRSASPPGRGIVGMPQHPHRTLQSPPLTNRLAW